MWCRAERRVRGSRRQSGYLDGVKSGAGNFLLRRCATVPYQLQLNWVDRSPERSVLFTLTVDCGGNMADMGYKPGRAILYLRATASDLDQAQDSTAIGETHRGVFFLRQTIFGSHDTHLAGPEIVAGTGSARKPVAPEGKQGRAANDSQSDCARRGARGRAGAFGVGAGGDPADAA